MWLVCRNGLLEMLFPVREPDLEGGWAGVLGHGTMKRIGRKIAVGNCGWSVSAGVCYKTPAGVNLVAAASGFSNPNKSYGAYSQ